MSDEAQKFREALWAWMREHFYGGVELLLDADVELLEQAVRLHVEHTSEMRARIEELEKESARYERNRAEIDAIVEFADQIGWNGVENSKLLSQFLKDEHSEWQSVAYDAVTERRRTNEQVGRLRKALEAADMMADAIFAYTSAGTLVKIELAHAAMMDAQGAFARLRKREAISPAEQEPRKVCGLEIRPYPEFPHVTEECPTLTPCDVHPQRSKEPMQRRWGLAGNAVLLPKAEQEPKK